MQDSTKTKRPRGRPPAYDRDAALLAITETFRRQGYSATSLEELSLATGMNRPSLFAAFGNKKTMYLLALDAFRNRMAQATEGALSARMSFSESLTAFFDAAIELYCSGEARGCLVFGTATAEALEDPDIQAVLAATLNDVELQLEKLASDTVARGETSCAPTIAAKILSAVLADIALHARAGVDEDALKRRAHEMLSVLTTRPL
ncbi:TetR/AcrR family transcriptional regulator [Paracoccus xiamenensis]|uniref:TetR/AcrR family transcriptional regulator n=1 Tax=Paracoccus xiamenensis TaxID=2714901 RepID=UPI00140A0209|nr:TetR/AcrR family transcriptional regulator [Paracoccus xiamenensis]NHF72588.1 TetR/AcrR family transcriptional regulator [Paracoccus xiamenensis]